MKWKRMKRSGKSFALNSCVANHIRKPILRVVSASVARHLFGTTDVVGRTIQLNKADYTITGVVKDVSKLATASYAQVWIPYTSTDLASFSWRENLMGPMRAVILARSSDDFPAIRAEVEKISSGLQ